jgi:hypothetical protein
MILFLGAFFTLLFLPAPARSQQGSYLDHLLKKSEHLRVHEEREWEVLLHYSKTYLGGYKSRIDDDNFFFSPHGKTDRLSELDATLRSFFIPAYKDGEHAACRFPARFEWLKARLEIDTSQLPDFTCSERDENLGAVEAKSAVLVFPVGHINSPASMFGHTLIRIDGSSRSNLISYAVNYSANTTDSNGFVYAWKGLTGLYKGYFSMMPYYVKVNEYNDLEHRDMWEYRLNLSEVEVRRMLNHIWELQNINSPYFFLDENCSYNLLFLIEAARPELHLTDKTGVFVLPTHTIRIALESGILEEPRYRPSQGTRIREIMSMLDRDEQKIAFNLAVAARDPESLRKLASSDIEKIKMLDLAAEFVQFRFARKEMEKDAYSRLYLKLLSERSRLGTTPDGLYDLDEPTRPETGHKTTKIAIGGGVRKGEAFVELRIQPEFHALLDPDQGFQRGSQIKFFDTSILYNVETATVQLKTLHFVDILSIAPRDIFFKPLSWKVNTGFDREAMRDGKDYLIYRLNTGGGYSYSSPFNGIWYALGELDINAGEKIRGGITAGPGFSIGYMEQITDWWKVHLYTRGFLYKIGDDRYTLKFSASQNFRLTQNNSLSMEYSQEYVNSHRITEVGILWNYYF